MKRQRRPASSARALLRGQRVTRDSGGVAELPPPLDMRDREPQRARSANVATPGTAARSERERPPLPVVRRNSEQVPLRAPWTPTVAFAHGAGIAGRPGRELPVSAPLREEAAPRGANGRHLSIRTGVIARSAGLRHATGTCCRPLVRQAGTARHARRSSDRGRLMTRVVS
jgi:hypothetical protein